MRVVVEDYRYPADRVDKVLWEGAFQSPEGFVSIGYVGYYWNDELKDAVFCLPKVLVDEDGFVFGRFRPEEIVDIDKAPLTRKERDFIRTFAVWIYRVLAVYKDAHPSSGILLHEYAARAGRGSRRQPATFLDVILALLEFRRRNRDFFVFEAKMRHSGFNKVDWRRTVARKKPVFSGGETPLYAETANRKREIDRDEELMVLFHSILRHVGETYGFAVPEDLNYEPVAGARFRRYLAGYGLARLRAIRHRYFSDRMVELWNLCWLFFDHARRIALLPVRREYLLAKDFDIVFEAMVDELLGDPRDKLPRGLKDQDDGKVVDHLFSWRNLTNDEEADRNTYYIGDSKYHKRGHFIGREAVAKQFTYARNVIQYNLNLFLDDDPGSASERARFPKLRDDATEGYNVVPNFFIGATMDGNFDFSEGNVRTGGKAHLSRHFENRLFDRDTLLVARYDVNFLFIVALYARNNPSAKGEWKKRMRNRFRRDIQTMLAERYRFYAMTPLGRTDPETFFREHFRLLLGKVFTPYDDVHEETRYYSLALLDDRKPGCAFAKEENEAVLECLGEAFEIAACPIGTDPAKCGLSVHPPVRSDPVPAGRLTRHYVENYPEGFFLLGCVKDEAHRAWIFSRLGKYKRDDIYNVRLGDRPGAVKKSRKEVRTPKFVILYDRDDERKYEVYRVRNTAVIGKERIRKSGYPDPQGDYFCYILDERVSLGELDIPAIRARWAHLLPGRESFAPLYLSGEQLLEENPSDPSP